MKIKTNFMTYFACFKFRTVHPICIDFKDAADNNKTRFIGMGIDVYNFLADDFGLM